MKAKTKTAAAKSSATLFQLEITLLNMPSPVWRRLQVPGNANLGWLHAVIQVAMGWTNSHLHQFVVGERYYSDTNNHYAEFESDPEILEASKFTLEKLLPLPQAQLMYIYDFGDTWEHLISVEKHLPADAAKAGTALCLDGACACPPEDCGGPSGYEELLKVLKNRRHPEHKSMKEWLGRPFDAKAFDIAETNKWLSQLKWPKVTEGHLRKVLMARDDYHE
jgi:hypothetical protein